MSRFIEGENREQSTLFPERIDEYISEENPVRVVDAFVDELNLFELGFESAQPKPTGRLADRLITLLRCSSFIFMATSIRFSRAVS